MDSKVKSSLGAPLWQFTSCMSGTKNNQIDGKKIQSVRRKSLFRRKSIVRRKSAVLTRRKSAPCTSQKVPDSWLRVYQADLQRERKLRETRFKKHADRTVKSTTFRSQHCLRRTSNAKKHQKPAGKDEGIAVFFKGLSLNVEGLKGSTHGPMSTGGDQCKVM